MAEPNSKLWQGYPEPQNTDSIPRLSADSVCKLIKEGRNIAGKDYCLVDVRRTDFEEKAIKGSLNLPAQSVYPTRHALAQVLSHLPTVICYCGSSAGRGPRVAGWLRDALQESEATTQVCVMEGGIKGFLKLFGDEADLFEILPEQT